MNPIKPRLADLSVQIAPRPDALPASTQRSAQIGTEVEVDPAALLKELSAVESGFQARGGAGALEALAKLGAAGRPVNEVTVQFALQRLAQGHPELLELLHLDAGPLKAPDVRTVAEGFRDAVKTAQALARFDEALKEPDASSNPFQGAAVLVRLGSSFGHTSFEQLKDQLPDLAHVLAGTTAGLHDALRKSPDEATEALHWLVRLKVRLPNAAVAIQLPSDLPPERLALLQAAAIADVQNAHGDGPEKYTIPLVEAATAKVTLAQLESASPGLTAAFSKRALALLDGNRGYEVRTAPVFALNQIFDAYPALKTPELAAALRLSAAEAILTGRAPPAELRALESIADGKRASLDALMRGDVDRFKDIAKRPGWQPDAKEASAALGHYLTDVERAWKAGGPAAAAVDPDIVRFNLPGAKGIFPEHAARIDALKAMIERPRA